MALSSDYQLLVADSQDGSMLVWNLEVIEMLHTLPGHSGVYSSFFFYGWRVSFMSEKSFDSLSITS